MFHSYVNVHMCNYAETILPYTFVFHIFIFISFFTHFSRSHGLNIKRYFHVERLFPPSYPPGRAAVNSSQVFGLCSAAAWRALCFWIGVFVPDRELEIRLRHFCTCIPFTSHLTSHYHSPPPFLSLCLTDTLVRFYLHPLYYSCSRTDSL